MSEIAELERRITRALERISDAAERTSAAGGQALRAELDEEKTANAQLRERIRALKDRHGAAQTVLEGQVAKLEAQIARQEGELERLRAMNERLRHNSALLREAGAGGVTDAGLINAAAVAELEALRGARAAERAETEAILGELRPIIEGNA